MDVSGLALAQTLINGALLGCLFGSMAVGLTIKWGLLGIADFFHISLTLLGAYLTYTLVSTLAMHPLLTVLITAPCFFVVGLLTQVFFEKIRAELFTTLLITFGLFIVAESAMSLVWSADLLTMRQYLPPWMTDNVRLPGGQLAVTVVDLMALVVAVLVVGLSWFMLYRTRNGRALKAMRHDRAIAQVFGVRLVPLAVVVSGLAAASTALTGLVVAVRMPINPQLPLHWLGIVVVSALLGGLGRPVGALVAAVVLMMIQNVWSLFFSPSWAPAIAFGVLGLYLALAPATELVRTQMRRLQEGVA